MARGYRHATACWMYVSKSLVPESRRAAVLDEVAELAYRRTEQLGVTGCFISARGRTAHLLEGPPDVLAELKHQIESDSRHTDVTTLKVTQIDLRRFSDWSIAYAGPSMFVAEVMDQALEKISGSNEQHATAGLLRMMEEFASERQFELPLFH